jgi:hypothetical protein
MNDAPVGKLSGEEVARKDYSTPELRPSRLTAVVEKES